MKLAKPFHNERIERTVISILESGMLVQGEYVRKFEQGLAEYIGCKHVVGVNSGTAALQLAIAAAIKSKRLPRGTIPEVITTPLSFAATANAALGCGCLPMFVDVDLETFNIQASDIRSKINDRTVAVEPVDVYGLPADIDGIRREIGSRNIAIVEDAAEAIGASSNGRKIGNISDVSCFSTYATKNLHTGEGGFVTTNNDALAEEIRMARNQGQASRYYQKTLGFNFRMLEISAAIGLEQIGMIDELNQKRRRNAQMLKDGLRKIDSLSFQRVDKPEEHAWYMFAARLDERKGRGVSRDRLVAQLRERGIEADVSWPTPIHLQPYYIERFGFKVGDYPNAEKICSEVFQLPIQPFLAEDEVQRTINTVRDILS